MTGATERATDVIREKVRSHRTHDTDPHIILSDSLEPCIQGCYGPCLRPATSCPERQQPGLLGGSPVQHGPHGRGRIASGLDHRRQGPGHPSLHGQAKSPFGASRQAIEIRITERRPKCFLAGPLLLASGHPQRCRENLTSRQRARATQQRKPWRRYRHRGAELLEDIEPLPRRPWCRIAPVADLPRAEVYHSGGGSSAPVSSVTNRSGNSSRWMWLSAQPSRGPLAASSLLSLIRSQGPQWASALAVTSLTWPGRISRSPERGRYSQEPEVGVPAHNLIATQSQIVRP